MSKAGPKTTKNDPTKRAKIVTKRYYKGKVVKPCIFYDDRQRRSVKMQYEDGSLVEDNNKRFVDWSLATTNENA